MLSYIKANFKVLILRTFKELQWCNFISYEKKKSFRAVLTNRKFTQINALHAKETIFF